MSVCTECIVGSRIVGNHNYLSFSEALPFFLLLIDLSKAASLAEFASMSANRVRSFYYETT